MNARTDLRLAIVGTGPAGMSLAWYLYQLGFTSVDFFESRDEIGGQSRTKDIGGVPVEMGTCYLSDGYVIAREIAHFAGTPPERLPPATFLDKSGKPIPPDEPSVFKIIPYVLKWFAWYLSGQMWRPTAPDNALTFEEWLKQKGLGELAGSMVFTDGCTAQLYGPLDKITALDGLSWVRPSLLLTGRREDTAHIPAGFQNMWKRVLAKIGYPVHFGSVVEEVRPISVDGALKVQVVRDGEPFHDLFDHVFIACPLDENKKNAGHSLKHPLSDILGDDFPPFDESEVYSGIWKATHWPLGAPSRCYLPATETGESGRLLTIRQYGKVGEKWVGQFCAYALENKPEPGPEQHDERKLANRAANIKDMTDIMGLQDVSIEHDELWRYSVRFSAEQLRKGLPAVISNRQGVDHVWYTGGALSHWDVDMISNFNQTLALRFAKAVGVGFFTRMKIVRLRDLFRDL